MTQLKPYPKYKDSGVEWIGEIPADWEVIKQKYVISVLTDYTANGSFKGLAENVKYLHYPSYARLIRLTDLRKKLEENEGVYVDEKSYDYLAKTSLFGGEFLIANVGANAGHIEKMPEINKPATLGPNMMMAKFREELIDNMFMIYAAKSSYYRRQLDAKSKASSAQPKLNKEDFKSILLVVPSKPVQIKIRNYLDHKTSKISSLISEKERLIELLEEKRQAIITETVTKGLNPNVKMKDSGIEWIGEIPEHWELGKVKYTTYVKGRIGWQGLRSDEFMDIGPHLVTGTDFYQGRVSWDKCHRISEERYEEAPEIHLKENDLLITKDGTIGKIALVKSKPEKVTLNSGIFVTRPYNDIYDPEYFYWVLYSNVFLDFIDLMSSGSTVRHLYQNIFERFSYPLPNKSEQLQIVKELNGIITEIDNLILIIEKQINKIKKYRESLIYEAVTGKIDLRSYKGNMTEEEILGQVAEDGIAYTE